MRISTIIGTCVGGFLMLGLAAPAAAQVKVDVAGSYQYFHLLEDGASSVPIGWGASVGVGKAWVKVVGDVAGIYKGGDQLHTFQGGVEFSGTGKRVVPFARVLSGVAVGSSSCCSNTSEILVITPEAGVKIMATHRIGIQASVGFPYFNDLDESTSNGFRLFTGIVIRK